MPQFTSLLTGAGQDAVGARRFQPGAGTGSFPLMGILNKRNAVLGWGVWKIGKLAAKRKAKQAIEPKDKGRGKGALLSALAAVGGAVWFWRRRRSDGNESG